LYLARYILTTNDRCEGVFCRKNQLFCDHHESVYTSPRPAFSSFSPYRIVRSRTQTMEFFFFLYASSDIRNVSEGDLYSKTQNCMFTRCFVADILKCDKSTIHRIKQLTPKDSNA
jgi:hypothetical protein